LVLFASTTVCCTGRPATRYRAAREHPPRAPTAFQGSKCVRGELKRRKYRVKAWYQVRANALLVEGSTLQGVTAASNGTHTHAGGKSRRLAWRCLARPSAGCGDYRRGAAQIPAGSPSTDLGGPYRCQHRGGVPITLPIPGEDTGPHNLTTLSGCDLGCRKFILYLYRGGGGQKPLLTLRMWGQSRVLIERGSGVGWWGGFWMCVFVGGGGGGGANNPHNLMSM